MAIAAVLLAAGYATRLYPLTKDKPKALLPLGASTILGEILKSLDTVSGLRKRLLVTNHRFAGQFDDWQRSNRDNFEILDDLTESPEMRLGAIRDLELARGRLSLQDDLLVIGTDNLFSWDLVDFVNSSLRLAPNPTVALWQAPSRGVASQFGVVVRDRTSRIKRFVEKSRKPPSSEVALCIYYFPSSVCDDIGRFLKENGNADAPGYFIEWLVGRRAVYGVMMTGRWYDIGTAEAYEAAVKEWCVKKNRS